MFPYTRAEILIKIEECKTAITAILSSQSVTIEGKSISRSRLPEAQNALIYWVNQLEKCDAAAVRGSGIRVRGVTPV